MTRQLELTPANVTETIAESDPGLEAIVRDVLVQRFLAEDAIVDIRVRSDHDHEGDPIYQIDIVVDPALFEARKMVGFIRHLRPKLPTADFPVVSYHSKTDSARQRRAAG